jgi:hypothetical protein
MRISPIGATLAIIGILLSNSANAQTISWQDHRINAATFWGVANAITASKKIADETHSRGVRNRATRIEREAFERVDFENEHDCREDHAD